MEEDSNEINDKFLKSSFFPEIEQLMINIKYFATIIIFLKKWIFFFILKLKKFKGLKKKN